MACDYRHRRRVEFADTDGAGIVHFARFLSYAEEAEHAFLRSLGLSVQSELGGVGLGFPRLAARFEYQSPARFEDEIDIHLWVRRKGQRSIIYQFRLRRGATPVAQGEIAVVCARIHPDGRVEPVPLPPAFAAAIEEAPLEPLEFRAGASGARPD